MGCYAVTCGMSGIALNTEQAVLIPLIPNRYGAKNGCVNYATMGASVVSNEGAYGLFGPLTLPIFGELDSYGRLENIEKDINTECIEKFYDMSIEDFCSQIAVGSFKGEKYSCGMYVERHIYEVFSHPSIGNGNSYAGGMLWTTSDFLKDMVLNMLGFEFVREDEKRERYNRLFVNPQMPNVEVWSDDTWIELVVNNKNIYSVYSPKQLVAAIEKNSDYRFPKQAINCVQKTPAVSVAYDMAVQQYREAMNREKQEKERLAHFKSEKYDNPQQETARLDLIKLMKRRNLFDYVMFMPEFKEMKAMFNLGPDNTSTKGLQRFIAMYGSAIDSGDKAFKRQVVSIRMFGSSLYRCNKGFLPAFQGPQFGDDNMTLRLAQETAKIAKSRIRKQMAEAAQQNSEDDED